MSNNRMLDLLRLQYVPRWGICKMGRTQTVAEHAFNVAVIAREIARYLKVDAQWSSVLNWALDHDGPESFTGDLPSTLKHHMNRVELREIEYDACPWYELVDAQVDDQTRNIVDLADVIEAVLYANEWCRDAIVMVDVRDHFHRTMALWDSPDMAMWVDQTFFRNHSYPAGDLGTGLVGGGAARSI
jgi:5'-deoxynucleotidase YfbR-like HD superfamily hydrolase